MNTSTVRRGWGFGIETSNFSFCTFLHCLNFCLFFHNSMWANLNILTWSFSDCWVWMIFVSISLLLPIALATPPNLSSQETELSKSEVPPLQGLVIANALVLPLPGFLIPPFSISAEVWKSLLRVNPTPLGRKCISPSLQNHRTPIKEKW